MLLILWACIWAIFTMFIRGFVTMKLWYWFAVPLGLPQLSYVAITGIALLVLYATTTSKYNPKEDTSLEAWIGHIVYYFLFNATVLGLGWVVQYNL